MPHISGEDRIQLVMFSLESSVATDAFVRVIDAFSLTLLKGKEKVLAELGLMFKSYNLLVAHR